MWDAATGELLRKLEHEPFGPVFNVAFSPDGRVVLTGGADIAVRFWDPVTGEQLGPPLPHHNAVTALAFSPTGETVVTGDTDQNVQLWDVATRRRLLHLTGHRGGVNDAAFSPDGRLVLTGSSDQTARLWDVVRGKPVGPPLPHRGPVVQVAFAEDGKTILTATQDQTTRAWPVPTSRTDTVEQLQLWAQVTTGMGLDTDGSVRILDAAAWQDCRQNLPGSGLLGSGPPR